MRNTLILFFTFIFVLFAVPILRHYLFDSIFMGRTFVSSSEWLDALSLFKWLFYLLLFAVFGFILSKAINSTRRWLWVVSLGILYSVFLFAFSRQYFSQGPSLAGFFWVYGFYTMPTLGASIGYFLHSVVSRKRIRHLTMQSR
jgi:hypothetical protein